MTLTFALRGSNGLVLAADSRVTSPEGSTADTSVKFIQLNREVGVVTYGLASPGYRSITRLVDEVNRTSALGHRTDPSSTRRLVYFSDISEKAQSIFKEEFEGFVAENKKIDPNTNPEDLRLKLGFILAGYDSNESNQFKILHWESPKFEAEDRRDILAAQYSISQYLLTVMFYPEMDVEQRLAIFFLLETETVSDTVGGPLQVATITLEDGFRRLNEQEIRELICENQNRFAKFRYELLRLFS